MSDAKDSAVWASEYITQLRDAYEAMAAMNPLDMKWIAGANALDDALDVLRFEAARATQTPPLLSQEEAFQRAVKAGLFAGLVSKPEDA